MRYTSTARRALQPGALFMAWLALPFALSTAFWSSAVMAQHQDECATEAADLIADKTIVVGDVNVCTDVIDGIPFLTVTYEAARGWCVLATDLHIAPTEDDIPQNVVGIPLSDQFGYGGEADACTSTVTDVIPLGEIPVEVSPGDPPAEVVIAAHARVSNGDAEAGAWGAGEPPTFFVKRGSEATYFTYTVQAAEALCACDAAIGGGGTGTAGLCPGGELAAGALFAYGDDSVILSTICDGSSNK